MAELLKGSTGGDVLFFQGDWMQEIDLLEHVLEVVRQVIE
jgi:hypothetical protein